MRFIIDIPDDNTTFNTVHPGSSLSLMEFRMRLESQECIPENNIYVSREYPPKEEEDTELSYWQSIRDIADEIETRVKDDGDGDIHDLTHEEVDGSSWITWYSSAAKVMAYTRNDDAYSNENGECPDGGWNDIVTKFAYYAMCADVRDEIEKRHGWADPSDWFPECAECGVKVDDADDLNTYEECPACAAIREKEEAEEAEADAETPDHSDDDNEKE